VEIFWTFRGPRSKKGWEPLTYINHHFSTQNTPLPVLWRKKSPRRAISDFHHLQAFLKKLHNTLSFCTNPMTCLKSATTRYQVANHLLRNTDLDSKTELSLPVYACVLKTIYTYLQAVLTNSRLNSSNRVKFAFCILIKNFSA